MDKKYYLPPEFELLRVWLLEEVLSPSIDDINHDHNDLGDGDDLFEDETDPDVNNDFYDLGDGSDLFD